LQQACRRIAPGGARQADSLSRNGQFRGSPVVE
jgi:hypothetical protein